jgi:hypothetical protein
MTALGTFLPFPHTNFPSFLHPLSDAKRTLSSFNKGARGEEILVTTKLDFVGTIKGKSEEISEL